MTNNPTTVLSNSSITCKVKAIKDIDAQIKELQAIKAKKVADVKDFIGDNETLINSQGVVLVTYKPYTSYRLDTKELKANEPEIYAEYSYVQETRKFLIK